MKAGFRAAVCRREGGAIILHIEHTQGYATLTMSPEQAHRVAASLSRELSTHHVFETFAHKGKTGPAEPGHAGFGGGPPTVSP
jgi:hypothetical protein